VSLRAGRFCTGYTLVEVLVALTVMSIGLLGMASLQARTLQASRAAAMHAQAATLAADLADRVRANRDPAENYTDGGLNARAQTDLVEWQAAVASTLPGGVGAVRFRPADPAAPAQYQIDVSWRNVGDAEAAVCSLQLEL
jgi:type IV pilus assembly protein PilV